jgi:hypothetical protein
VVKIDLLAWEFEAWLEGTKAFLDAIDRAVSEAAETEAADRLRQRAESEGWEAGDYFAEDQYLRETFGHWLPRLSAYAVIILLQSLVEDQLRACAKRLRRDRALSLDVRDLHGRGVEPARNYLVKVANLDVANDLGWHELSNLQALRNIIVHRRGRLGESGAHQEDVRRLIKEYPEDLALSPAPFRGLEKTAEQELTVTFRLCSHFIREVDAFFHRLFKAIGVQDVPVILG